MPLSERIGAHIPWGRIDAFADLVLALDLVPEIAFKGPDLDDLDSARLARTRRTLDAHQVRPTVHAPFFDLNPGALDPLARKLAVTRLSQCLQAASELNARLMVVHPGYDKWRYPGLAEAWVTQAEMSFRDLLRRAAECDCRLALENIYEETPQTLTALVETIDSPWLGHCFDIGHWRLFGTQPIASWLESLGSRLIHLHLHDNHGVNDDHLPLGCGAIAFEEFFAVLAAGPARPSMTLEAHTPDHLVKSLHSLRRLMPADLERH